MKILVGIMYCIENEFEQCKAAIEGQNHKEFEYFVIEKLPNKEAHDKLYATFMLNADRFDLFIKVDADMVLCRNTFFEEVEKVFRDDKELEDYEIGVFDHFTQQMIYGLHIFRNTVKWDLNSNEPVFVDMTNLKAHKRQDFHHLAPAADHCPNPSDFQSFHYGVHKAIKVSQPDSLYYNKISARYHFGNILRLREIAWKEKSRMHILSYVGAMLTLAKNVDSSIVNFNSSRLMELFQNVNNRLACYFFLCEGLFLLNYSYLNERQRIYIFENRDFSFFTKGKYLVKNCFSRLSK